MSCGNSRNDEPCEKISSMPGKKIRITVLTIVNVGNTEVLFLTLYPQLSSQSSAILFGVGDADILERFLSSKDYFTYFRETSS